MAGSGERIFYRVIEIGTVSEDWKVAFIVLVNKGKGNRSECANYEEISILNVLGKEYQ